jgi:hypothetical protein
MKSLSALMALSLLAMTVSVQSAENLRAVSPTKIRMLQTPSTPEQATPTPPSACGGTGTEYAGMCWDKQPQFGTYFGMAAYCGDNGGRLPMLGELAGFMAHFAISGSECSSDFDAGAGTLWCASSTSVSGTNLSQQAKSLYEVKAEFRCVRPLPRQ